MNTKSNPRCPVCGVPMERTKLGALRCGHAYHDAVRFAGFEPAGPYYQRAVFIGNHGKRIDKHNMGKVTR